MDQRDDSPRNVESNTQNWIEYSEIKKKKSTSKDDTRYERKRKKKQNYESVVWRLKECHSITIKQHLCTLVC